MAKKSRNLLKRMLSNLQVKYDLGPVCRGLDRGAGGERLLDADQPLAAAEKESLHPRQFAALQGRHHAPERPQVQLSLHLDDIKEFIFTARLQSTRGLVITFWVTGENHLLTGGERGGTTVWRERGRGVVPP